MILEFRGCKSQWNNLATTGKKVVLIEDFFKQDYCLCYKYTKASVMVCAFFKFDARSANLRKNLVGIWPE